MRKSKAPCFLFNRNNYIYPNGLRVTDQDELDTKLKSGEWNTGPVDKKGEPTEEEKAPKVMSLAELVEAAKSNGIEIVDENLVSENKDSENTDTIEYEKPFEEMIVSELTVVAGDKGITILDTWLKADLLKAIIDHKE